MKITESNIVGELVAEDYRTASVFKSFGIDFCCKGNRSIREVCDKHEADIDALLDGLNKAVQTHTGNSPDFRSWPLDLLTDYVVKKHHRYLVDKTDEIMPFLSKVVRVHGGNHPELVEIGELFTDSAAELSAHMHKEEQILFPFIKQLSHAKDHDITAERPHFGSVENPVAMMKEEHLTEGERFRKIAELTDHYMPPRDACNTYKVTFALLKEFEADLHEHIHLENNILFPRAIALEKEMYS